MTIKITRINQITKERPKEVFTSIYHLINFEHLKECYDELDGNKAIGLDEVTKDMYSINLDENLNKLVDRLKTKSYRPNPTRRGNIPKANQKLLIFSVSHTIAVKVIEQENFELKEKTLRRSLNKKFKNLRCG